MKEQQDLFSSNFDFWKVIQRFWSFRQLYIILTLTLLILAFLINRYSTVKYRNTTTIYLTEDEKSGANPLNSQGDLFQSFGLFNVKQNIDNELEIIRSFSLIKRVVNETNLKVTYYSYKNGPASSLLLNTPFVRKNELYNESPIEVVIDPSVPQSIDINFNIEFLNENEFTLNASDTHVPLYNFIDDQIVGYGDAINFNQRFRFGDEIKTRYFNFRIQKTQNFNKDFTRDNGLFFHLNNINVLTSEFLGDMETETTSETSTIIRITFTGTNRQLVSDFLNNLTSAYLGKSLDKKNKTALSTIDFIDSQLSDFTDSMNYVESTLKNFRTAQGVMDLNFQGQQVFEQLTRLENEKAAIDVQKKYYQYLANYLESNSDFSDIAAPSSMNVIDPLLSGLVTQLITYNAEKATLVNNSTNKQNLYLSDLNIKIDNLKKTIKETVKNTLNTLNISLNEINYRMQKASGEISQMPKTELQMRGIERKFKLNESIITYLQQKRSEAQIARASSMPDYEVIDPAIVPMSNQVIPKSKLNYIIAILLGLILPSAFIMLRDILNTKIVNAEEIEGLTSLPILGKVFHNFHRTKQVVIEHPNSSVSESFRAVRTNFQFFSEGGKRQVLLVTSTSSGEGKTFCSMNIASVFALNGHRTILLEFDLRRPKIHQEFGSSNIIGISSFLIDKANLEDIIVPTGFENLDLISAGPAAPNPAELIATERTAELIDKLKEMYDYIIIDSAPAGLLTETQMLMKLADLNIFVARIDKTLREAFKNSLKSIVMNKFNNVSILINDLNVKREAFKYGYDNKYYTDDKSGFLSRLFKRKKAA
jgi:tyrosine-protein kinase Etk/Wzc